MGRHVISRRAIQHRCQRGESVRRRAFLERGGGLVEGRPIDSGDARQREKGMTYKCATCGVESESKNCALPCTTTFGGHSWKPFKAEDCLATRTPYAGMNVSELVEGAAKCTLSALPRQEGITMSVK